MSRLKRKVRLSGQIEGREETLLTIDRDKSTLAKGQSSQLLLIVEWSRP